MSTRSTHELERSILANLAAQMPAFHGFSLAEIADYAETVRIENEARTEHEEAAPKGGTPPETSGVPFVDVWHEDGVKLSRAIRVF